VCLGLGHRAGERVSAPAIAASSDDSRAGMAGRTASAWARARISWPTSIPRD